MDYAEFEFLCRQRGIKAADVTRATGITSSTFSSWKQGKYSPKAEKLRLITEFFGLDEPHDAPNVQEMALIEDIRRLDANDRETIVMMVKAMLATDKYKKAVLEGGEVG